MIDGRTTPTRPFAERHAQARRVLLPGDRTTEPRAAAALVGVGILVLLAFALGVLVGGDCAGRKVWAQSGAIPSNPAAQSAPVVCGPQCRWSPEAQQRTRAAWPMVRAAAVVDGVEPALLGAICAWETMTTAGVKGGLGGAYSGPAQVSCAVWLQPLRNRHGAPGLTCDDMVGWTWGLASGALAFRESLRMASGDEDAALCAYALGMRGVAMVDGCPYSRAVQAVRALLVRDLGDLVRPEA